LTKIDTVLVGAKDTTVEHYKNIVGTFEGMTGKRLESATAEDILKFLEKGMEEKGWKRMTVLNYLTTLRNCLRLIGRAQVAEDLRAHVKRFSKMKWEPKVQVYIPPEVALRMIEVAPKVAEREHWEKREDALFIAVAAFTGLRLSEILSIRVRGIDFKERTIKPEARKFREERGETGGEGGKVVMNELTASLLRKYIRDNGLKGDDPIFTQDPTTYEEHIKLIAQEAGVEKWKAVHPHLLRHSHAISWLRATRAGKGDIETMRGQMGWKDAGKMIMVYGDFAIEERKKSYDEVFP